jgi:hypothetical protein
MKKAFVLSTLLALAIHPQEAHRCQALYALTKPCKGASPNTVLCSPIHPTGGEAVTVLLYEVRPLYIFYSPLL